MIAKQQTINLRIMIKQKYQLYVTQHTDSFRTEGSNTALLVMYMARMLRFI